MASKKDAYRIGVGLGEDFVRESPGLLNMNPDPDNEPEMYYTPEGIASEAFEHYSQFSPWEFTAQAFNESRDPDGVWAAFEQGLAVGARKAARAITREA